MKTILIRSIFISLFFSMCLKTAHSSDKKAPKETLPGSLQYQFLIGDWDIKVSKYYVPEGGLKEESTAWQHAEYKDDGQMIVDEWTGYDGKTKEKNSYGITLRTYSEETQQWQNVYMRSNQKMDTSSFMSQWIDNEMIGIGQYEVVNLGTIKYRLRFYNITENSFEWEQKLSKDDGKNWYLELKQVATRRTSK